MVGPQQSLGKPLVAGSATRREQPGIIDPSRFASEAARLTGRVTPAQLPRVAQMLVDEIGAVDYELEGYVTPKGEAALRIVLAVDIALACQRCLERLPLKFESARRLVLTDAVEEFEALDEEDDDVDAIPSVARLDVLDLIDQEVMLNLPIAPRHAEGECEARNDTSGSASSSPFAALARLKQT